MSSKQDDEFLPEDEMMEEIPEDGFQTEEENPEITEGSEAQEAPEDGDAPEFSPENEEGDESQELAEIPEKEKPIEYRPPRMDLYTMLLVLSLIFVSLAAAIHWLEVPPSEYGTSPWKKNSPLVTAPKVP